MSSIQSLRDRNDAARKGGHFGPNQPNDLFLTPGVQALGDNVVAEAFIQAMRYTAFEDGELDTHDFGALDVFGHRIFWKIDQKDSRDPQLVMTLLLPDEY